MATNDVDDFLEDETFNQFIAFPPEVISAIDQVNMSDSKIIAFFFILKKVGMFLCVISY